MKKLTSFLIVPFVALIWGSSFADVVPTQINFQGVLSDTAGTPISNASKSIQFTIYDSPSGGNVLWSEALGVTTDNLGRFTVILGKVSPLYGAIFADTSRYMGVKVESDPEISPRSKISSSAYALRTRTVNLAQGGTLVGGNPGEGAFLNWDNGNGLTGVSIQGDVFDLGGEISLYEADGDQIATIHPEDAGVGGNLTVWSNSAPTANQIRLSGNYAGIGEPVLGIYGSSSFAQFSTGSPGDGSVQLPTDAISSPEILDEPGVAGNSSDSYVPTGSITPMLSRTITCPDSGYVLAVASCEWQGFHTAGTTDLNNAGLSSFSSLFPGDQDLAIYVDLAVPSGNHVEQLAAVDLLPVAPGDFTVYFNCLHFSGVTGQFRNINLELVYLPTKYGTVLASAQASQPVTATTGMLNQSVEATPTVSLDEERAQSVADNQARIQKELEQMQAQLDGLKKQLEQNANFKRFQSPQR